MKIKKHIKAKRQYVSPSIYVKVLQMEGLLGTLTAEIKGDKVPSGEGGGGNPINPFGVKANSRVLFDDETEE